MPSRSSYFGIVDLAGFKKDRFYLYQARWRPDLPMAHILPHWNWPERVGQVTPVHVYTSGDEAELFLNGKSLGRKKKGRTSTACAGTTWSTSPASSKVVAYRHGKQWARDRVKTTGEPAQAFARPWTARASRADGQDLAFVTVTVADGRASRSRGATTSSSSSSRPGRDRRRRQRRRRQPRAVPGPAAKGLQRALPGDRDRAVGRGAGADRARRPDRPG